MPTYTRWPGDDGHDRMAFGRSQGWTPIPAWGLNGWNLGGWPLVVVYHRGDTELAVDVEGDIDTYQFSTKEERDRKTDEIAFFHWQAHEVEWVRGIDSQEQMPDRLRGPFSWRRLKAARTAAKRCRR